MCVCVCVRDAQRGRGCVCMSVCGSVRTPAEFVRPEPDWPTRRLPRDAACPPLRAGQAVVPHRDHPASDERVLAGPARTPTHRHAPLTVPRRVQAWVRGDLGGMGGTFSAPTNILRTAGCACEREQRSASDGLGRALTQCPAGQSRVRTVGKQAAAQRRDEGAPRGRKEALAVSCPSAAAGRSLDPLALQ